MIINLLPRSSPHGGEVLRTVLFFPYKPSSYGGTFNIAARIARIVWMPAASACTRMQERIMAKQASTPAIAFTCGNQRPSSWPSVPSCNPQSRGGKNKTLFRNTTCLHPPPSFDARQSGVLETARINCYDRPHWSHRVRFPVDVEPPTFRVFE